MGTKSPPPKTCSSHSLKSSGSLQGEAIVSSVAAAAGSSIPLKHGSYPSSGHPSGFLVVEAPDLILPVSQEAVLHADHYSQRALVCRFNGFWPKLADLHSWVLSAWAPILSSDAIICPCARGFFVVIFGSPEDRDQICKSGPWFWGRSGLSLQPWPPSFDASTADISSAPVWVRLPNLPLHFWGPKSLQSIGNALGKFHSRSPETKTAFTTFARICVEMDFTKGFPAQIILQGKDRSWTVKLDYEYINFRCRVCFETGHIAANCKNSEKKKLAKSRRKPTWWEGAIPAHQSISKEPDSEKTSGDPAEQTASISLNDNPIPTTSFAGPSWADQAEEALLDAEPEQSKEWTKVTKKKKPPLSRQPVLTRSQTGSLN